MERNCLLRNYKTGSLATFIEVYDPVPLRREYRPGADVWLRAGSLGARRSGKNGAHSGNTARLRVRGEIVFGFVRLDGAELRWHCKAF